MYDKAAKIVLLKNQKIRQIKIPRKPVAVFRGIFLICKLRDI